MFTIIVFQTYNYLCRWYTFVFGYIIPLRMLDPVVVDSFTLSMFRMSLNPITMTVSIKSSSPFGLRTVFCMSFCGYWDINLRPWDFFRVKGERYVGMNGPYICMFIIRSRHSSLQSRLPESASRWTFGGRWLRWLLN